MIPKHVIHHQQTTEPKATMHRRENKQNNHKRALKDALSGIDVRQCEIQIRMSMHT